MSLAQQPAAQKQTALQGDGLCKKKDIRMKLAAWTSHKFDQTAASHAVDATASAAVVWCFCCNCQHCLLQH